MIMFDFWLDYKAFPCDKIESIISPLCYYYEILVGFNILLSEESFPSLFASNLHITDSETTNRRCFRVQLEIYLSDL